MLKEFKEFVMRGNVLDLAVGVIIGAAFGKIVSSLVADILMPPIGLLLKGIDFADLCIDLKNPHIMSLAEAKAAHDATINYGTFLNAMIDFLIVAFCVFMVVQFVNHWTKKPAPAAAAPTTKDCPQCAMTIPIQAKRCGHCTSPLPA
jgi:large conductance mechanosensitive channel